MLKNTFDVQGRKPAYWFHSAKVVDTGVLATIYKLLMAVINTIYPQIDIDSFHISEGHGWRFTCGGECDDCKCKSDENKAMVKRAGGREVGEHE